MVQSRRGQTMQKLYEALIGEKNTIYYQEKFDKFDKKGPGLKASWNWAAFFFPIGWALYRKMYGWFLLLLCILFPYHFLIRDFFYLQGFIIEMVLIVPVIALDIYTTYEIYTTLNIQQVYIEMIFIIPWIAFTIYSNSLYQKNLTQKITKAKIIIKEEDKLIEYLKHKGGVHPCVIWVFGTIAALLFISILYMMIVFP